MLNAAVTSSLKCSSRLYRQVKELVHHKQQAAIIMLALVFVSLAVTSDKVVCHDRKSLDL